MRQPENPTDNCLGGRERGDVGRTGELALNQITALMRDRRRGGQDTKPRIERGSYLFP